MGDRLGLDVRVVPSPKDAVAGMDLVVTSGPILKNPSPTIQAGWLSPGSFASPVDFDSYWTPAALAEIDRLATDDLAQMDYYRTVGYFKETPTPYADLGEIVTGRHRGRLSPDERTMSMNLGLAIEDVATARVLYAKAVDLDLGVELPL
jgi:ornithine cyclodeaminase/alanine dehydrogenase